MNTQYIEQLTEVKKGHEGTGLLIEHDGYIDRQQDIVQQIKEDIDNNHKFVIPEHFVVSAVFQKYGIKNANGRIYPEDVLKSEVSKYQTLIKERRALGSLDHPSCQLADTQILTEKGWKKIQDVELGENILTVTSNKKIEIHPVVRKIDETYKGKMYHFKGRFIDITVTPNHKFPIWDRHKKWKGFYTAEDLYNNRVPDQSHSYFFKTGEWHNNSDENFILKGLSQEEVAKIPQQTIREKYIQDVYIPMDLWMKFMGIYLSEGDSCYIRNDGKRDGSVNIHQKKQEIIDEIEEMLREFPLEYLKYTRKDSGTVKFVIRDLRLAKYLNQFGKCYDKYVPYEIKKQGKDMLRIFYDWFVMGDGRKRGLGPGRYYSDDVFSTSKQLVMDLNEIQLKIGYCGSYHEEDRHKDRLIEGRLIKAENSHNMYFTMRNHCECIVLSPKSLTITEEEYDGRVYCVEVENHTFYTMCKNGKCLWSGNSTSISGHDISHNILSLEWQGHTLVGEMELHLSPGYIRYGVCSTSGDLAANMLLSNYLIGVSSRGVGTVEQKFGEYIVQPDFEIICWDIVIENSTPGAVIKHNREELRPYMESNNTKKEKPSINETKLEEIEKILIS